jgi:HEAT repeat protein
MTRHAALIILAAIGAAGAAFLSGCGDPTADLDSGDAATTVKALRECAKIDSENVATKVAGIVEHEDTMVAAEAVRSLGRMDRPVARKALRDVATGAREKRGAVRQEAVIQLGRQDDPEVLPVLRQVVQADPDPSVRAAAATSIARQRSLPDVALLVEIAEKETDPIVQARAVGAVERLIGLKFGYDPKDPPELRRKALLRMRSIALAAAAKLGEWRRQQGDNK